MTIVDDTIAAVEACTVKLPIPRPLRLGAQTVVDRTYAVVRVRTADGLEGNAFGLSRGTPTAAVVVDLLAPLLLGQPADTVAASWDLMVRSTGFAGRVGTVMRAISLVDAALWDVKGRRAGLPVWRLLGGHQADVPCMLVAGYPTEEKPADVGARVAQRALDGHSLLKVARLPNPHDLGLLLQTAAKELPPAARIVVDAAYWWRTATEAAEEIRGWADEAPLAWVEDPIMPEDVDAYARLTAAKVAPIGVGDELTDRFAAKALLHRAGIDVLRIDATTIGGISGAWWVTHLAESCGVPVSYHVYPETHIHLAAATSSVSYVETFGPPDNPFDPASTLYGGGPVFRPGSATAPETPGLGFEIDQQRVARHRVS